MNLTLEESERLAKMARRRGSSWRKELPNSGTKPITIKEFMPEEYAKIPPERIWSFLDVIITAKDHMILHTWMKHLEKVKVPYIVTEQMVTRFKERDTCKVKILWCERKA